MNKYLHQVHHNADFLRHQCQHFSDKYFDWKVICCFYVAYHAIMALARNRNIYIGKTHSEISSNINPKAHGKMPVNMDCWKNYRNVRIASESARYNGFDNLKDHEDQNCENLKIAFTQMNEVLKYCNKYGVEVKPLESRDTIALIV